MQFKIGALFALATTAMATLPAHKACGNNVECAAECYQGTYDVAFVNDQVRFVCTQSEPQQLTYTVVSCDGSAAAPYQVKKACNANGGTYCEGKCAIAREEHYDFAEWCERFDGFPNVKSQNLNRAAAFRSAGC
ncbi:hypothetical protein ASPWEDRAFT_35682 [Aspergillus wentii DTO 134E9]|uniref:Uncharacterized protein n=1 Tax=Aspergillus wentii DTO 134E9 TaxID=1073089 RepID=A0A1L9RT72_ASPWE|nr:uncharacterized protein ASPWEDRAFT_35682 [Aspergillus wentii DTO 134E9]OJJ38115.1 hypothetical protein ASPWEDRAFT_35682 [Aspergillus wentii DTO 134E9]